MTSKKNSAAEWEAVAVLASAQMGLITRAQLREIGFSERRISHALRRGALRPVLPTVFSLGHDYLTPRARLLAATLACGPGTVVSHGTAAWLLGLGEWRPLEIDVIAPAEGGRKIATLRRRFVPPPKSAEVGIYAGVPTTGVARTLVDLAGILHEAKLSAAIEQAAVLRALDVERIDAILAGAPRRGSHRLLSALAPWRGRGRNLHLRSRNEAKLFSLLAVAGAPLPETNARLSVNGESFEIDLLWRRQRVAVEADSRRFHDNPIAAIRDSHRNRALVAAGFLVGRFGWGELEDRPEAVVAEISKLLDPRLQLFSLDEMRPERTATSGRPRGRRRGPGGGRR